MASIKNTLRKRRHNKIRKKIQGSAENPRLVVFRSLNFSYAQLIDDKTGVTLASASDMKAKGKASKTEKALEIGKEIAKLAKEKKIETISFDRNGYKYHGRVKAIAEGAREGGLKF